MHNMLFCTKLNQARIERLREGWLAVPLLALLIGVRFAVPRRLVASLIGVSAFLPDLLSSATASRALTVLRSVRTRLGLGEFTTGAAFHQFPDVQMYVPQARTFQTGHPCS